MIELDKENQQYEVYYAAVDSVNKRFKSIYELQEVLKKKQYSKELIDIAVDKLLQQGYLNDRSFAKSYINNQIITTNKGPYKIKRELLDRKVDEDIVNDELINYTQEEQLIKIEKIVDRMLKSNHTRGGVILKQKVINQLKNLGYDSDLIMKIISEKDFSNNESIRKQEYEKLKKRLSRKYSGSDLEKKINERLYQKGLYYEE